MPEDSKNSLESSHRYLTFFLANELYGIKIENVREIIAMMSITVVPKTPKFIKGVMNLRGNIIPVVDMCLKFNMACNKYKDQTAIVIVTVNNLAIGFTVDNVEEVIQISNNNLMEAPSFGTNIDTSFLLNMIQLDKNVVMILNLDKIFADDELLGIGKLNQQQNITETKG